MTTNGHDAVMAGLAAELKRLWRYGLVLSGKRDVAEDLVQATCLRALERAHQFTPGTRLDRWLFSILHSIWLNEIRAVRYRTGQGLVDAETELTFDGAYEVETNILAGQVLREVNSLPEVQREAIELAYFGGLTQQEIAARTDAPLGTVKSRVRLGLLALRGAMAASTTVEP